MLDDLLESMVRTNAVFFTKGRMPDILKTSIPASSFCKDKIYIIALIEVNEPMILPEDPDAQFNITHLAPIEDRRISDSKYLINKDNS